MGNLVVYPAPKSSYEHISDDPTLLYVEQKIDTAFCGGLGCTEKRKCSVKIPCRYIPCKTPSPYLIMFFHGNSEDIGYHLTQLLIQFGERFMMNVICAEYPSYGIYKEKDDSLSMEEAMINDAKKVLKYCKSHLGYQYENIILIGRSLGTGVAVQVANDYKVRGVVMISPFTSIRGVGKFLVGNVLSMVVPDVFRSIDYIQHIKCPVLYIHGEEDGLIPYSMSVELYQKTPTAKAIKINEQMSHNQFRTESDVFSPIHGFMVDKLGLKPHLSMKLDRIIEKYDTKLDEIDASVMELLKC